MHGNQHRALSTILHSDTCLSTLTLMHVCYDQRARVHRALTSTCLCECSESSDYMALYKLFYLPTYLHNSSALSSLRIETRDKYIAFYSIAHSSHTNGPFSTPGSNSAISRLFAIDIITTMGGSSGGGAGGLQPSRALALPPSPSRPITIIHALKCLACCLPDVCPHAVPFAPLTPLEAKLWHRPCCQQNVNLLYQCAY